MKKWKWVWRGVLFLRTHWQTITALLEERRRRKIIQRREELGDL